METADNLCFRRFNLSNIKQKQSSEWTKWHKNIVRRAQKATAHVTVKQGSPTILRFIMCRMESRDIILNVFSLSYLWEN